MSECRDLTGYCCDAGTAGDPPAHRRIEIVVALAVMGAQASCLLIRAMNRRG